ncbi:ABC transporter permease subunit [Paraburkholderia saeva]|jgi:inositol transport system permease protein|uniref:Ribose import permease protein RbsC n=1 Tax=Paraburkholderia saeva TaxID=2777537 RepID=A0A9N8X2W2_9BURK|nr:ribose ABC transporter [Paraburkholderia saeva]CAG4889020.1 Ribose import permease protein RbsC [Paraburkholderia saeva]CAG4903401.1 Ribose import permease protein RbsC [Paraburkholderia saeva]CAG4914283.1 Ribose import permease protein RbsC [Paraburkholderia saeva]
MENSRLDRLALISRIWPWLFLCALLVFFEVWAQISDHRSFIFNAYNLQSIGLAASAPLLLAIGQTFVIITAGIDLSVGFVMGLAAVCVAQFTIPGGNAPWIVLLSIPATILVCLVPGLVNGVLIARLGVPAFIGTLGMYGVARGVGFLAAGSGMTVPVNNPGLAWFGHGWTPVVLTAILLLIMHFVLSKTRFGQYTYAIGGNPQSAVRAGINVRRHLFVIYLIAAAFAAIGGIVYTSRFAAGAANAGEPMLLDSIAAVVIGGASLFGGTGNVIGTLIGALIIAVIEFGLVFIDVNAFWQFIVVGIVIIMSVLIDQYKERLGGAQ